MLRRLKCTLSVQERAKLETQVLQRLRGVQDDIVGKDLVTLNRIKVRNLTNIRGDFFNFCAPESSSSI